MLVLIILSTQICTVFQKTPQRYLGCFFCFFPSAPLFTYYRRRSPPPMCISLHSCVHAHPTSLRYILRAICFHMISTAVHNFRLQKYCFFPTYATFQHFFLCYSVIVLYSILYPLAHLIYFLYLCSTFTNSQ